MPTIQVREVPDDVHETICRRARTSGLSLQRYMLRAVIDWPTTCPTTSCGAVLTRSPVVPRHRLTVRA